MCICGWGGPGPCPCPNNPANVRTIQQAVYPQGCVCPPTSERTCENPICPRQNRSAGSSIRPKPQG